MILKSLLSLLFPSYCIGCHKIGAELCISCMKEIQTHPEICILCHTPSSDYSLCAKCKWKQVDYAGIAIAFAYTWLVKKLILALKYYHKYDVSKFLGYKLSLLVLCNKYISRELRHGNKVLITHVPSHRTRKFFSKWYNQSELLAKHTALHLGIEHKEVIKKTRFTSSQTSLERSKRLVNLKTAFSVCEDLSDYKTIIIIDDITTTWSTIQALAHCIKSTYPQIQIRGAVLARSNG